MSDKSLARRELEGFFLRREERGKLYCARCLAEQLTRRGTRGVAPAAWLVAVDEAFAVPDPLQVSLRGPCKACGELSPSIGLPDRETATS